MLTQNPGTENNLETSAISGRSPHKFTGKVSVDGEEVDVRGEISSMRGLPHIKVKITQALRSFGALLAVAGSVAAQAQETIIRDNFGTTGSLAGNQSALTSVRPSNEAGGTGILTITSPIAGKIKSISLAFTSENNIALAPNLFEFFSLPDQAAVTSYTNQSSQMQNRFMHGQYSSIENLGVVDSRGFQISKLTFSNFESTNFMTSPTQPLYLGFRNRIEDVNFSGVYFSVLSDISLNQDDYLWGNLGNPQTRNLGAIGNGSWHSYAAGVTVDPVPEPASAIALALGLGFASIFPKKKK